MKVIALLLLLGGMMNLFLRKICEYSSVFALGHKKTGSWDPIGLKKRGPQNKNWVPT